MNLNYLGILTLLAYLSVALAQGLHLLLGFSSSRWRYLGGSFLAIISHGWILYNLIETPQGQNLDPIIMLSFTLWLMNIFTLIMAVRAPIVNLCILTYPLTAVSLGFALYLGGSEIVVTKTKLGVLAHIFISFFAMSLLALACFQALLLGFQNYLLKRHHSYLILKFLPPLQTMEGLLFLIIWSGMGFLSASLLSGFFYQHGIMKGYLLSKSLLAVLAWILLTLLLVGRYLFGWRGPTAIRWTLIATILAILSYFGTKAVL